MEINDYSDIFNIPLYDCYFIYMGDDNEEYPVLETLKAQRVFNASTFICREPILNGEEVLNSKDDWQKLVKSKNKKYILIFADLKIQEYFFELLEICKKTGYPIDKIIIIVANDDAYISNELKEQYIEFIDTHLILDSYTIEKDQILQKGFRRVMNRLPLNEHPSTITTLCDDLSWEFELKYLYKPVEPDKAVVYDPYWGVSFSSI